MVILLLLFTMSGNQQAEWKDKLTSALKFYRENRELIAMLAQSISQDAPKAQQPQKSEPKPEENHGEEKSRPAEVGNQLSLLEEYLNRHAL